MSLYSFYSFPWSSSTVKVGPFKEGLPQVPVLSLLLPMVLMNRQSWSFQRGSPSSPCPLSTASHRFHQQSKLVFSRRVSRKSQSSLYCSTWSSSTDKVGPFKEGLPQVPVLSLLLPMVFINSQSRSFQRGSPSSPSPLSTASHGLHQQSKLVLSKRVSLKSQFSLYCFPWSSSIVKVCPFKEGLPHVPVLSLLLPYGLHQQTKLVLSKRVSLKSLSSLYCFPWSSSTVKVSPFKECLPQVPVLSLLLPIVFINSQSWSFQRGSPSSPCPLTTASHRFHQQSKLVLSKWVYRKSQSSLYCFPWSSSTDKVGPFKEGLPRVPVLSLLLHMVFINRQSWSFQRGSPSSPCPLSTASHLFHQQSKLVLSKRVSLKSKSSLYCSTWSSSTDKVGPFKEGLPQVPVLSLLLPMVFINSQS